ncbi:MAG: hypothetical protein QOH28_3701 [Actinomycetota bacterium]|nr:hypothetical protein [Actinomycetota bacterium]
MDVDLSAEDALRRREVRRWFREHPAPRPRELVRPVADARGRRAVVAAVQRARRRIGSREPRYPRRARRRRLPRERPEDLDVARGSCEVRHPHRAHARWRLETSRHLLFHRGHGSSRHRGSADPQHGGRRGLQRGFLHRRARSRREPDRRREPRLGHGQDDTRERAGVSWARADCSRRTAPSEPSGTAAFSSVPRSPSAAEPARCCTTSSPNASSGSPTTSTSSRAAQWAETRGGTAPARH